MEHVSDKKKNKNKKKTPYSELGKINWNLTLTPCHQNIQRKRKYDQQIVEFLSLVLYS